MSSREPVLSKDQIWSAGSGIVEYIEQSSNRGVLVSRRLLLGMCFVTLSAQTCDRTRCCSGYVHDIFVQCAWYRWYFEAMCRLVSDVCVFVWPQKSI